MGSSVRSSLRRRRWLRARTTNSRDFPVLNRRGRPKANVALARKLLVRLYVMLRDHIDYDEFRRRGQLRRTSRVPVAAM